MLWRLFHEVLYLLEFKTALFVFTDDKEYLSIDKMFAHNSMIKGHLNLNGCWKEQNQVNKKSLLFIQALHLWY